MHIGQPQINNLLVSVLTIIIVLSPWLVESQSIKGQYKSAWVWHKVTIRTLDGEKHRGYLLNVDSSGIRILSKSRSKESRFVVDTPYFSSEVIDKISIRQSLMQNAIRMTSLGLAGMVVGGILVYSTYEPPENCIICGAELMVIPGVMGGGVFGVLLGKVLSILHTKRYRIKGDVHRYERHLKSLKWHSIESE